MTIFITNTLTGSVARATLVKHDRHYRLDWGAGFLFGWKRANDFLLESPTDAAVFSLKPLNDGTFEFCRLSSD